MSSFVDASARLHLMKHFEGDPTMQTIMEYGRMAQMTQDEVIRYLDIIGNKQWEAMKQQYGIKAIHGPRESSDEDSNGDEESNAEKRVNLLSHKIVQVKSEEKRLKKQREKERRLEKQLNMAQDKTKDGTSQACNENKESLPVKDTASPLDSESCDGPSDTSVHGEEDTVASSPKIEDFVKVSAHYAMIGNKMAGAGDLQRAAQYFTEAIKYNPTEFKLFGNRAFCFEKMQEFEKSLSDAELSLSMSPGWVKGLFRKGRALAGLKRYKEAAAAFKEILELDSSSKEAAQEMMRVQTLQLMEYGSVDKAQEALSTSKNEENTAGIWTSPDLGKAHAVQSVHFQPSITATAPLTVPQPSPAKVSNRQLPESLKLKMIDAHKAGEGYKKIAKRLQVPIPSVRNVIKKWQLTGTVEVKERSGRPRKITDIMVHNIVTKASQNPYLTVKSMQEELAQTGVVVHCSTIKRYLYKHGVHGKKTTSVSSAQTSTAQTLPSIPNELKHA